MILLEVIANILLKIAAVKLLEQGVCIYIAQETSLNSSHHTCYTYYIRMCTYLTYIMDSMGRLRILETVLEEHIKKEIF